MGLKSLEQEYVMGDFKTYCEFDNSHFISNAKSAITGKVELVNLKMKFDYYSSMLSKAITEFDAITIDKSSINEFMNHFDSYDKVDKMGAMIHDLNQEDVTVFKPQYIAQYIRMIQEMIGKVIDDDIPESEIIRYLSNEFPIKVEKQTVKTTLPYGMTTKALIGENSPVLVKVDSDYLKNEVIPFINKYQQLKDTTLIEAKGVLEAIKNAEYNLKMMEASIENIKTKFNLPFEKVQKLNQVSFNALRGIIDIISFVSFMMIRKMHNISSKAVACEGLYNDLMNLYSVTEGALEHTILPTDSPSLREYILDGSADQFVDLSTKIYNFHASMPSADEIEDTQVYTISNYDSLLDSNISDTIGYDIDVYIGIAKAFISISSGLDIIGREGDEYLMIFDDILQEAGLNMPLDVMFKSDVEKITDVSSYQAPNPDKQLYIRALTDVHAFGDNMTAIAKIASDTYNKIKLLDDRFTKNVNNEYKDTETVNEIKSFLTDFLTSFSDFTEVIAKKFFDRLHSLGHILTDMESKEKDPTEYTDPLVTSCNLITDNDTTDYSDMAFESIMNDMIEEQDAYFKALESSYYIERERVNKGINVVLEADENNNTTVSVQDNSTPVQNASTASNTTNETNNQQGLASLKADITAFINSIISKFTDILRKNNSRNAKWLALNKDVLLSRSYSNVTLSISAYNNMPVQNILTDIGKVKTYISSLSPQNLQNLNSIDDLYKKMFPSITNLNSSNNLGDQLKNYYKVGKTENTGVVPIANSQLKTFVSESMIPYCESYYGIMSKEAAESKSNTKVEEGKFIKDVTNALTDLAKTVDNKIKSYGGTESNTVTESVSIFTEADTTVNNNTDTSIKEKANWLRKTAKTYSGSIMNALRDRANDYMKGLSSLTPKAPVSPVKETKPSNNNNQPQNSGNQTTQNNGQNVNA